MICSICGYEHRWVQDELPKFRRFCARIRVAAKEVGAIRLARLLSSQIYLADEIFRGLDEGIHDFVILKSRQLGASTLLWALDLWWLERFSAMQAMYIADDGKNLEIHRRIMLAMYGSIPDNKTRGPLKVSNSALVEWSDQPAKRWVSSRLMWDHGNAGEEGQIGRSLGLNYLHAEELDGWSDDPDSLVLAREHPHRLYLWVGTGQGYKLLYQMWDQAGHALTRRRIFIGWHRLDSQRLDPRGDAALWKAYGAPRATPEEREWIAETMRVLGVEVDHEMLAWWRMTMAESPGIKGNLAKMLQEHPWFPDQSFQAAGSQFITASTMRAMHQVQARANEPHYYRFDWGQTFDERADEDVLIEVSKEAATLTIWEEAEPAGLYVVAGDPAFGSSQKADSFAATVWRCWPDRLVQVAQYHSPIGAMYQFAWTLVALAGAYPRWLIYEVTGPGYAVLQEIERMKNLGFGLSKRGGQLQQVIGNIQEYLYLRPDTFTSRPALEWKSSAERREWAFTQLQDTCERGALTIRSLALWNEIGALRREGTRIEAGGVAHDDLAITAALAVEYWLSTIVEEIQAYVPPKNAKPTAETEPTQRVVRSSLRQLFRREDEKSPPKRMYGVRASAPGR